MTNGITIVSPTEYIATERKMERTSKVVNWALVKWRICQQIVALPIIMTE